MLYIEDTPVQGLNINVPKELSVRTHRYIYFTHGNKVCAVAGEYLPDLFVDNIYFFLAISEKLSQAELREGLRQAREYLRGKRETLLAEVDPKIVPNCKLLRALGFEFAAHVFDRDLYIRRN